MNAYTLVNNLALEIEPPANGTLSRTIHQDDRLKAVLFGFAAGQDDLFDKHCHLSHDGIVTFAGMSRGRMSRWLHRSEGRDPVSAPREQRESRIRNWPGVRPNGA